MLGLGGVLRVSHAMEDLLGALRDGRLVVRSDLVDLLLSSCDAIGRALPGGELDEQALEPVLAALAAATGGQCPVTVPVLAAAVPAAPAPPPVSTMAQAPSPREPVRALVPAQTVVPEAVASEVVRAGSDSVRVAASKVYELLDVVGEADLSARRIEQTVGHLLRLAAEQARWSQTLRQAGLRSATTLPPDVALALHRLVGAGTEMSTAIGGLRELVEDHRGGMAQVRDGAMGLAMVPVRRAFAPLARIVRDVAQRTGKVVRAGDRR